MRKRPSGKPVMYQQWRDLLFLHWEFPFDQVQATLPEGLYVDTFGGKAYLGIVPFFMRNVRPRILPAVPGLSHFMELNLRTYVHDRYGAPGVWFYSLDANQWLAVQLARRLFHLPYEYAEMESRVSESGAIRYRSMRVGRGEKPTECAFNYAPGVELPEAAPGSLEFFLIERYRLYACANGKLRSGAVFHPPYPLCRATLTSWDEHLFTLNGFAATGRLPDHTIMSRGVDVAIFPLKDI